MTPPRDEDQVHLVRHLRQGLPAAVHLDRAHRGPGDQTPGAATEDFHIDAAICMNCGFCAEYCPFDAIKMDHDYELSYYPSEQKNARLIPDVKALLKPDTYHAAIHPSDWAMELQTKADAAAKKAPKAAAPAAVAAAPVAAAPAAGVKPGLPVGMKPGAPGAGIKPGLPVGMKPGAPGAGIKPAAPKPADKPPKPE